MRTFAWVVLLLFIFSILGFLVIVHNRLSNIERKVPYASLDTVQVYSLINAYRNEQGREPLRVNPLLEQSARAKLYDMALEHYWSHNTKEGEEPWHFLKMQGYNYTVAGENLAQGFTSAQGLVDGWKASVGHKKNLLEPKFTEMGLSYLCGSLLLKVQADSEFTCLVVMHYATR
jgi:uncharacterized protein YkwD